MTGKPPGKVSRKALEAIAALMKNNSVAEASKACGVSERTLFRWLKDQNFVHHYKAAQRKVVDSAIRDIQGATAEAVATLRRNLNCGNAFAENSAAQTIITNSLKAVELGELQERIENLEASLDGHKNKAGQD